MSLPVIERRQIPQEQSSKLLPEEIAHHFSYIDAKGGGCANGSTAKQWILITNQRILFEASVKQGSELKYVEQYGSIPIAKVSYVGILTSETSEGCSGGKTTNLRINSSGGEIVMAIPTQEEAGRIQRIIDEIISKK